MQIFTNTNFDFLRWRWHALALSLVVILAGAAVMVSRGGLPLGIDFSGGTIVVVKFDRPVAEDAVRKAVESIPGEKVVQQYGRPGDNEVLVRLPQAVQEQGFTLEQGARQIVDAITRANLGKFEVLSTEVVGPVIGAALQRKGIYATLASILGITIYIAFRFRPSFAIGAIAATFHDILVTVAFLAFFGYDLSLNVVAAILTITGYSVNDTIVIFDRVRENLRFQRRDSLANIVNTSVNQTLGRTIITAGTTFLAVFALYLFGGEVLEGFAFTMLVGIVSGTYSTVFIASAIAILLSHQTAKTTSAAPAPAAAPSGNSGTASKAGKKPARKRAS
jgi:preprotein translocase subunit SecF